MKLFLTSAARQPKLSVSLPPNSKTMDFLSKHIWLVEVIGRKEMTFDEIAERWEERFDEPLLKRRFYDFKVRIEDLFNITIACDRSKNTYKIKDREELKKNNVRNWMLENIAVSNTVLGASKLYDRILVEENPSAHKYLAVIIEAMKENFFIAMKYHSFQQENPVALILAPYFLKEYGKRWYVYGISQNSSTVKLYALDRILSLEIVAEQFELPSDFSARGTVATSFGVTLYPNIAPELITIKAYNDKPKYLDSLPLHHSQKVVERCESYTTYTLYVAPTIEFYKEIFAQLEDIEVINPKSVRDEIKRYIASIKKRY